jgi:crotonobetainyl-CoA:carnitine CoA-transferase CaiB-like acyl-CoA transferase
MYRLPLHGVRVLDLTMAWAGPYATRLLADMGAEVIKVEAPVSWDLLRIYTGQPPETERLLDRSALFNHMNRNKYGLSLDLSKPRGRELFLELAAVSDVVIENFRAEVMDNLGLTYSILRGVNEKIIIVSMPAHGHSGPEKDYAAFGTNVEQLSGLTSLTGYEGGPPVKTGISYGDPVAGVMAAGAVALALWDLRRTGEGQYIELAQRETLTTLIGEQVLTRQMTGEDPPRRGNRHPSMAPHGAYRCAGDDQWLTIACEDDAQFAALSVVMGQRELARDERFADVLARLRNRDALDALVEQWTITQEKEAAAVALQAAGVPTMPVLTVPEVFADGHLRARGFYEEVAHPVAGVWEMEGPHWRLSETPAHVRLPGPTFGEHTQYVLGHILGLTAEEIAALEADGVAGGEINRAVHE